MNLIDMKRKLKRDLVTLGETEALPRHFVSVRKDLDPASVQSHKDILLAMHQTQEGQKILERTDKITKFDLLPGGRR